MPEGDFYLGSQDIQVGEVLGVPYYMHTSNLSYWKHLLITIDAIDGVGNSFSLESMENKTFILLAQPFKGHNSLS